MSMRSQTAHAEVPAEKQVSPASAHAAELMGEAGSAVLGALNRKIQGIVPRLAFGLIAVVALHGLAALLENRRKKLQRQLAEETRR